MDTLLNEALQRLDHPAAAATVAAAIAARVGYEGEVSPGSKRTRAIDPSGSVRLNDALLPLVYSVSEDGVASPIVGREADFATLAVLQGEFAAQTREAGLSTEERSIGYNCSVSLWKGSGTPGKFLGTIYSLRKSYASLADYDKTQMQRLNDLIVVFECLLGDPTPEAAKSAVGVAALFAKRRG